MVTVKTAQTGDLLIYINDLDIGIKNTLLKFADDTKVFGKISDPTGHFLLQDDMNQLIEWSTDLADAI